MIKDKQKSKNKKILRGKIKIIVEKTDKGFSAFAQDYAVFTKGKSLTELQKSMLDALNQYFEDEKKIITAGGIAIEIDLKQFFQHYKVLNAKFLAERIGMNPTLLSQYVQGRKKPSPEQTEKILTGIQEIGKELMQLRLTVR